MRLLDLFVDLSPHPSSPFMAFLIRLTQRTVRFLYRQIRSGYNIQLWRDGTVPNPVEFERNQIKVHVAWGVLVEPVRLGVCQDDRDWFSRIGFQSRRYDSHRQASFRQRHMGSPRVLIPALGFQFLSRAPRLEVKFHLP